MASQPRVAIVTGSSKGIGAAIVRRLAADGFAVVVNYSGDAAPAEQVVAGIEADGGRAIAVRADVSDAAATEALFDAAEQAFGPVTALVNNAGIMTLTPIADATDEEWEQIVGINLTGVFNSMRTASRRLADGGRIVSLSSSVVGLYQPSYGPYAATKAAVEAMSHILAKELGPRRITVNVVAPGPVGTELFLKDKSDAAVREIVGRIPLGRLGEPDDIAGVVAFLVGPDGGWVNGQVLRANGGII